MMVKGGWMNLLFCLVRLAKSQANKVLLLIAFGVLSGPFATNYRYRICAMSSWRVRC